MKDYYAILGISKEASSEELKTAYRTLMKIWHPDVCFRNDAYERFTEIVEAYEVLNDPHERQQYDAMREPSVNALIQEDGENTTTPLGCLFIILLIVISLTFVAFIAYKVYLTLHGVQK